MRTKRELLNVFAEHGYCKGIRCTNCFFKDGDCQAYKTRLLKIGAKEILKLFPDKRIFDKSKILTCITAEQAKIGTEGYFGDSLNEIEQRFINNIVDELVCIRDESHPFRFTTDKNTNYTLFYPKE